MKIEHIYISPEHNFFGHYGQPAGETPTEEVREVTVEAGKGLVGDRFYGFKENYKGQVTFFSQEVHDAVCAQLQIWDKPASVYRRNIIVSGVDLNSLIGQKFTVQGVEFEGVCECSPCDWMDQAMGTGAEAALKGRGGLRARALSSGKLVAGV
jgi:MOSC domain-containing protein YiiM